MVKTPVTTAEQAPSKAKTEVIREAKRIEEALLYSSKGHYTAAAGWGRFHLWIGVPMVILSVLSSASAIGALAQGKLIATVCSLIVTILSSLITFLNPNQRANTHFTAGNKFDALMNRARIFWSIDCWQSDSDELLTTSLKDLSDQKSKLNGTSPQVPGWAYLIARRGIESGEAKYEVDRVVDGHIRGYKATDVPALPAGIPANEEHKT